MTAPLKAPFPWFGGKSRVAHLVWRGFGDVVNYVEPFFGSGAVLLGRPTTARIETVNDRDMYLANFWRAVQQDPAGVAFYANWPVNEADLHARHRWLVRQHEFRERMKHDPEFYDVRIAGWWVWGISMWIGGGWCAESNWNAAVHRVRGTHTAEEERRPTLLASNGVHRRQIATAQVAGRPSLTRGKGVHARTTQDAESASGKRPHLSKANGVHRVNGSVDWEGRGAGGARAARGVQTAEWEKRPNFNRGGRGVASAHISEQLPSISGDSGATGRGIHASGLREPLLEWMLQLRDRLRRVRVCCGDWSRVLGRSVTDCIGMTAVFLDPPYSLEADRDPSLYGAEDLNVAHAVREWALENGSNPKLRIALCGYAGEHEMPKTWRCVPWKAVGGYAASAGNTKNSRRERIWFSPACDQVTAGHVDSWEQVPLFGETA